MTESLKATVSSRDLVNRACGMLMERHGISHDQAMQEMIRNARAAGATLVEVSEQLVTRVPPAER
jgi:AmiR/NasT family two-component response regulator